MYTFYFMCFTQFIMSVYGIYLPITNDAENTWSKLLGPLNSLASFCCNKIPFQICVGNPKKELSYYEKFKLSIPIGFVMFIYLIFSLLILTLIYLVIKIILSRKIRKNSERVGLTEFLEYECDSAEESVELESQQPCCDCYRRQVEGMVEMEN